MRTLILIFLSAGLVNGQHRISSPNYPLEVELRSKFQNIKITVGQYEESQSLGLGFQIAGALVLGGALTLQAVYNERYQDDLKNFTNDPKKYPLPRQQFVPVVVPAIGTGVLTAGIAINMHASSRLRLLR